MKIILYILIPILLIIAYRFIWQQKSNQEETLQNQVDTDSELDDILEKVNKFKLDVIKITPRTDPIEFIWQSKFGGKPYWPKDMDYPENNSGKPLHLLAQINFSEVPELEGHPKSGMLQFFIDSDDLYGQEFLEDGKTLEQIITNPNGYRVIYHENIIQDNALLRNEFPSLKEDEYLPLTHEYSLVFSKESEGVSPSDYRFGNIIESIDDLSDDVMESLYEILSSGGSKIGGYAHFTQEDPRPYNDNDEWLLLFQMDSDYDGDVQIMWGDSGVANFFIRPEDLKRQDFSKVWYNWDCY